MAMPAMTERKLYRACKIIFGPELAVSHDFLQYLQRTGLKSAYRQRAMETHPDRGPDQSEFGKRRMAMMFHTVREAYQDLSDFLEARENGLYPHLAGPLQNDRKSWTEPAGGGNTAGRKTTSGGNQAGPQRRPAGSRPATADSSGPRMEHKKFKGSLPARKLLFGHFLYYSGLIDWQTLVKALMWQRRQQPRLGELGRRLGWLDNKDILSIMRQRAAGRPFGRSAVQLGILSESQLKILLSQQKKYRRKIGGYFVEKNILTPRNLAILVEKSRYHNRRGSASHLYPL